ncbi:MAG: 4-hydroxy-tetrahydrodipicolinate reductase [Treponema sp.]|jgi:4-hydroxy-tetrahydrodipicolinate reductase|nr:4-hydroxy-tetrahydrodipicolinate reductase [Treponema sp.]
MNIAIIGYGKMGKILESLALERGHRIAGAADPFYGEPRTASGARVFKSAAELAAALGEAGGGAPAADVALEFTRPDTAAANIRALAEKGIPVVAGTTGWLDRLEEVKAAVKAAGSSLLWASNFSLGVHIFFRIAAFAAKLADPFPEYDVGGFEVHHNKKADSPSGTAKTLAETLLGVMTRKTTAVYQTLDRPPGPEELHYASLRVGSAPGVHSLCFDSPADTIEITHTARNREGLASGALAAAQWLLNCPGPGKPAGKARRGIFTMDDVLEDIISAKECKE